MRTEIQEQLEKLAFKRSTPFCYNDYIDCPTGRCPKCGSDDLMRSVVGVGCEYGLSWVIEHVLESELTPVNIEEDFEQSIRESYPESCVVGWMTFDSVSVMKEMDPIAWRCAQGDFESQEESEGNILSLDGGSTYYRVSEIEDYLKKEGV